jgi:hypothetical protein
MPVFLRRLEIKACAKVINTRNITKVKCKFNPTKYVFILFKPDI